MKFKKDGKVFEDIGQALESAFQCNECCGWSVCKFGTEVMQSRSCSEFAAQFPAEAARLMGYEVVEGGKDINVPCKWCQDEFCTNPDSPMRADYCPVPDTPFVCLHEDREETQHSGKNITTSEEEAQEHKKGVKSELMKQDKLFKDWTLGEVKEYCSRVRVCHKSDCPFSLGHVEGVTECFFDRLPSEWDLTEKPRFTQQEVEYAKTLVAVFDGVYEVIWSDKNGNMYLGKLKGHQGPTVCGFTSIQPGRSVKLSEIVGDNP